MTDPDAAREAARPPAKATSCAVVTAQVGVLFVTFVLGVLGAFVAQNAWFVALAQAAAGIGFVAWLARKHPRAVLLVPVVSFALTAGLAAASNTVAIACSDRALEAFEQVPSPPGVALETFVSPSQGCMVAATSAQTPQADLFDHYRSEFQKQGWRLSEEEGLWAERNDVYINLYNAEGRTYFLLGICGEWGTRCLADRNR